MTHREKLLLELSNFFDSIKLDHFVFASSLLGIVREGKMMSDDQEVDLCCLGEDLTPEMFEKLKASKYYLDKYDCKEGIGEIYFSLGGDRKEGWSGLSPLWKNAHWAYLNMVNDDCMLMPLEYYDKKKWGNINYLGKDFKCPHTPKKWLKHWYGSDWETPKDTHWKNSRAYQTHDKINN